MTRLPTRVEPTTRYEGPHGLNFFCTHKERHTLREAWRRHGVRAIDTFYGEPRWRRAPPRPALSRSSPCPVPLAGALRHARTGRDGPGGQDSSR